jgi:hypothetical protein
LPEHDDVHRQILERDQDKKWRYGLISSSAIAETKEAGSQETDPGLQRGWCPLSECLRSVAAVSGKLEDAWPEVKNAISDGELRARGTYFGIDHQPLQPEWLRIAMWDDANDDTIFFRREKGNDLVPPQRVPGHITNIEVSTADIQRCWPPNGTEAPTSSPADVKSIPEAGDKPAPRSVDVARQGTRAAPPQPIDNVNGSPPSGGLKSRQAFVSNFFAAERREGREPTISAAEKAWTDAGGRGHREQIRAATRQLLEKLGKPVMPGRPRKSSK